MDALTSLQAAVDKANGYVYGGKGSFHADNVCPAYELVPLMEQRYRHRRPGDEEEDDEEEEERNVVEGRNGKDGKEKRERGNHSAGAGTGAGAGAGEHVSGSMRKPNNRGGVFGELSEEEFPQDRVEYNEEGDGESNQFYLD